MRAGCHLDRLFRQERVASGERLLLEDWRTHASHKAGLALSLANCEPKRPGRQGEGRVYCRCSIMIGRAGSDGCQASAHGRSGHALASSVGPAKRRRAGRERAQSASGCARSRRECARTAVRARCNRRILRSRQQAHSCASLRSRRTACCVCVCVCVSECACACALV